MIKMKLKIAGTGKKEVKDPFEDLSNDLETKDPFEDLSDSELEALQIESNVDDDETEDVEKAIEDVSITDETGIKIKYIENFEALFPNKKIIYNNLITKQFLEWFIKTAVLTDLKKFNKNSQYINPAQQQSLIKLINKRVEEDNTKIEKDSLQFNIELESEQEYLMYEFILSEKWSIDNKSKGILELDAILEEQMRLKKCDIGKALSNILKTFELEEKFVNSQTLFKPIELKKKETMKSPEISKAITYFHYIEFLYKLMSKMEFVDYIPIDEEIAKIEKIKEALTARSVRKEVIPKAEVANSMIDKMMNGGV